MNAELKEIVEDWHIRFPFLKNYTPPSLFMKAGPMLIGLRFDQLYGSEYSIFLEMVPLWIGSAKFSIVSSIFLSVIETITIQWNDMYFHKAVARTKQQFGDILKDSVSLESIFDVVDRRIIYAGLRYDISALRNILRIKLAYALYFDNREMTEQIKALITKQATTWNTAWTSKPLINSVDRWLNDFFIEFNDREHFMKAIESNLARPKIARLNSAQVINMPNLRVAPPTKIENYLNCFHSKIHRISNYISHNRN